MLPIAIDRAGLISLGPRSGGRVVARVLDLTDATEFAVNVSVNADAGQAEYLRAVAWSLPEAGYVLCG